MAFLSLAAVSAAAGAANFLLTEDPRRLPAPDEERRRLLPPGSSSSKAAAVRAGAAEVAAEPAGVPGAVVELESAPLRLRSQVAAAGSGGSTPPRPGTPRGTLPPLAVPTDLSVEAEVPAAAPSSKQQLRAVAREVAAVLRIPTFRLIVAQVGAGLGRAWRACAGWRRGAHRAKLCIPCSGPTAAGLLASWDQSTGAPPPPCTQGVAGSVPWSALVFLTLYLQLLGMSDAQASSLVALFLLGGWRGGVERVLESLGAWTCCWRHHLAQQQAAQAGQAGGSN